MHPSAWRQCPDQVMQTPRRRGNKETEDLAANKFTRRRRKLQIEKAGGSVARRWRPRRRHGLVAAARGGDVQGPGPRRTVGRGHGREDGKVYYGNTKTGATQWARPVRFHFSAIRARSARELLRARARGVNPRDKAARRFWRCWGSPKAIPTRPQTPPSTIEPRDRPAGSEDADPPLCGLTCGARRLRCGLDRRRSPPSTCGRRR